MKEAKSFYQKTKGLMFQKKINYCLKLRCNGLHTFFMKEPIDIITTNRDNQILFVYHHVAKNKIIWPKKNVYFTYEFPAGSIDNEIKKIRIVED